MTFEKIDHAVSELKRELESLKMRAQITDEMMKHLSEIYCIAWTEANYDPYNERSMETARKVLPHIEALNRVLHFKR